MNQNVLTLNSDYKTKMSKLKCQINAKIKICKLVL
jgi:hypothetical protein